MSKLAFNRFHSRLNSNNRSHLWSVLGILFGLATSVLKTGAADYFVATNGSDTLGNGTAASPWATVGYAVSASSSAVGSAVQKNIWVSPGEYWNTQISMLHGANDNTLIAATNGTAILYGGQLLTNWISIGHSNWVATLPAFPTLNSSVSSLSSWQPRILLADGVGCARGRLPATGKFHYASLSGTTLTYTNTFGFTTNMELWIDRSWNDSEVAVVGINPSSKTLTLDQSVSMGPNTADVHSFALVNIPEAINGPNQFWWDKTNNAVVYCSPDNADPNGKEMIVPTTDRILYAKGFGDVTSCISNVVISNITFAAASTSIGQGWNADNGGGEYPASVEFTYATNCIVDGCTVHGVACNGIGNQNWWPDYGTIIRNCTIYDIGASGIGFAGSYGMVVSNNLIYNCGLVCQGGTGVRGGSQYPGGGMIVTHNTITNVMGAGIQLTSGNPFYQAVPGSIITYNTINRAMQALRDMGAIYASTSSNALFAWNYIANVYPTNSDNGGVWDPYVIALYSDEGTINCVWASNILFNCGRPIMYHRSTNCVYINNFFVDTRNENTYLNMANSDRPVFQRNILVSERAPLVEAENTMYAPMDANAAALNWHSNIFWSLSGLTNNAGTPTNAIKADPVFYQTTPILDPWFGPGSAATNVGISRLSRQGIGRFMEPPFNAQTKTNTP